MEREKVYLIDGSAYIYRAYHALTPLSNSKGLPTHAIYGFTTILRRILRERSPKYIALTFDSRGPVFRHEIYPDYKANRPQMPDDLAQQLPYIKKIAQGYNILCLEQSDQEADDLIASVTEQLVQKGYDIVIVSSDKDLLQLVNDKVFLWDPMKDKLMDPKAVLKRYGVETDQLLDYFSLTGDSSDNIPGVHGIGPKTAQKLISENKTLENIYASIDKMVPSKLKQRLVDHKDEAFLSRDLIRLNHTAAVPKDIDEYLVGKPDRNVLCELLTELEFFSILKTDVPARKIDTDNFFLVRDMKTLRHLSETIKGAPFLVLDTETTSLDQLNAELVGISLCIDKTKAWYIPCGHRDNKGNLIKGQLSIKEICEVIGPIFEDKTIPKIGHNLKYDWAVLSLPQNGSIHLAGPYYDTMVGAWLLDPGRRTYKLDDLCQEIDLQLTSYKDIVAGDKQEGAFSRVGLEQAKNYSCEDVYGSLCLFEKQKPQLNELQLWSLYTDVECPLIPVLAGMELHGIVVDTGLVKELSSEFGQILASLEEDIYKVAGNNFNINSPSQLGKVLFVDLDLPKGRKTKTGYSTDVKVLERLKQYHELPGLILEYRNLAKLKSTYLDNLTRLKDNKTGRVHTSFNQCGTTTGRLSSSNPNLQNIPIRTEEGRRIRAVFYAPVKKIFISGDYSQIDLRVLAHYSRDEALLDAFFNDEDIHSLTAAEIFFVSPALITPEMRRVAKTINFGIVYGMSSFGLSSQLNLSRKEAQIFIDRYFQHYKGIKDFMEAIIVQARSDGYVTTLLGRRRQLPDINSSNRTRREFAERTAINTPIQGTAADIIKLAMLRVSNDLVSSHLNGQMVLQVHDELVLEVAEEEAEQTINIMKRAMENVIDLIVPLKVNLKSGQNLGSL